MDWFFLVRADDRLVEWESRERRCSVIQSILHERGKFREVRRVEYHGAPARQYVAEAQVRLLRTGQRNRPHAGDRQKLPGPALPLRLVLAEVCDGSGQTLATWRCLRIFLSRSTTAPWPYGTTGDGQSRNTLNCLKAPG